LAFAEHAKDHTNSLVCRADEIRNSICPNEIPSARKYCFDKYKNKVGFMRDFNAFAQ
jgi:hypothetical protein